MLFEDGVDSEEGESARFRLEGGKCAREGLSLCNGLCLFMIVLLFGK